MPPISKNDDNHLLDHPHVFLDEIMRQAQESEIIRLTMDIRNGKSIPNSYDGKEVKILPKKELNSVISIWINLEITMLSEISQKDKYSLCCYLHVESIK